MAKSILRTFEDGVVREVILLDQPVTNGVYPEIDRFGKVVIRQHQGDVDLGGDVTQIIFIGDTPPGIKATIEDAHGTTIASFDVAQHTRVSIDQPGTAIVVEEPLSQTQLRIRRTQD